MLFERVGRHDLAKAFEGVKFVSFDYDRFLEWFLLQSLAGLYGIEPNNALEVMKSASGLHPYGEIGAPSWCGGKLDFYGSDISGSVVQASKRLLTYTEGTLPDVVKEIRTVVQRAETIVFLGFAFHAQNIELLIQQSMDLDYKVTKIL